MPHYDNSCPRCHEFNIEYNPFKKQYECHNTVCGYVWTEWSEGPTEVSQAHPFMRVSIRPGGFSAGGRTGLMPHEARRLRQLEGAF
jgi:hypothetical protein